MSRLLLLSTSTIYGSSYLDYAENEIRNFFQGVGEIVFAPYALHDRDAYAAKARERFARMGIGVRSLHEAPDALRAIESAQAVFVGGGNTFRLLEEMQRRRLIEPLRRRVELGMPYMGASAGSNLACPTIKTTNDMPIVQPSSFESLSLIPFQMNPHYLDPVPGSTHMGETREQRIREFHEMNETPVLGLREGAWIRAEERVCTLRGERGARLFRRGAQPEELADGASLEALFR